MKIVSIAYLIAITYPRSPNLCLEAVVDCVGKQKISIQCSCLIAPPRGYQCANIQVLIARSITASVHKFRGCGDDDAY